MCYEDIKLGKRRYVSRVQRSGTNTDLFIAPDGRRVALLISWDGPSAAGTALLISPAREAVVAIANRTFYAALPGGTSNLLLRLEEVGSLVQEALVIASVAVQIVCVTEICDNSLDTPPK